MLSFLVVDAAFYALMLFGLIKDPVGTIEIAQIPFLAFYVPFSIPFVLVPVESVAIPIQIAILGIVGTACHALLGAFIGDRLKRVRLSWYVTVPTSMAVLFSLSFIALLFVTNDYIS